MKKVFITGANKSIGFETAKQLANNNYYVFIGSRNLAKGEEAVTKLKEEGLTNIEAIEIDVSSPDSVTAARKALGDKTDTLDVLINNAGISGVTRGLPQSAISTDLKVIRNVFDTNFFGIIDVTQKFMDLLEKSEAPRIVNVTSGLASLTLHSAPSWKYYKNKTAAYVPSKVALNAYTIVLAYELKDIAFKVNAVDPGFTATDFNQTGAQIM